MINLNKIFIKTLDILYPPKCLGCYTLVENQESLCSDCWKKINFIQNPQCKICGYPFHYQKEENFLCVPCIRKEPSYDKARAVFIYDENSSYLIKNFKYNDNLVGCNLYARWLANIGKDILPNSILIPIPLHPVRLFIRKYNQAALIANTLGRIKNLPVLTDGLIRNRYIKPQYTLNNKQRFLNVKGVFNFNKKYNSLIKGKNIILIDDVMTTGATVEECSKVLKKETSAKIFVLTLAKTIISK